MSNKRPPLTKLYRELGFVKCCLILFNFMFYKLEYITKKDKEKNEERFYDGNGYYLVKRVWMWVLFSPLIIVVISVPALIGVVIGYFKSLFTFRSSWIAVKEQKLSFAQKVVYRLNLWPY